MTDCKVIMAENKNLWRQNRAPYLVLVAVVVVAIAVEVAQRGDIRVQFWTSKVG